MKLLLHHNIIKLRPALYLVAIISFINYFSTNFYVRIDLTEDKRNSLNSVTKNFLSTIKEPVSIKVYLHGNLPVNYKRLRNSLARYLDEFKIENDNIDYQFIDVDSFDEANVKLFFDELKKNRLYAHNIFIKKKGKKIERYIYPFVKIEAKNKIKFINLLNNSSLNNKNDIIASAENFEYNLIYTLHELFHIKNKKVGIISGIGEPPKHNFISLINTIKKSFNFSFLEIKNIEKEINNFDAIIIANPQKPLTEKQKFFLDQYLMNGGNLLFFLNNMGYNSSKMTTLIYPIDLNINDLLYTYGARINSDIIGDRNCSYSPIIIGNSNTKNRVEWFKWPYKIIIHKFSKHIIIKNLGQILGENMSSIDLIKKKNIKHSPLMFSSKKSCSKTLPITIDLKEITSQDIEKNYKEGPYILGALIEGKFESHYKNKFLPIDNYSTKDFKEKCKNDSKIFLVSSGFFLLNKIDLNKKKYFPLGYDDYFQHQFSQNHLIENVLSYMLDDYKLIYAKKKNIKLRLLNEVMINKYFLLIQLINIFAPIILLIISGFLWEHLYRKKYKI